MISYKSLYSLGLSPGESLGDVNRFRRAGRTGMDVTDSPDQRFFKILFYFYNDTDGDPTQVDFFNGGSSGLLSPTWLDNPTSDFYKYNSAWAYLKNNYEEERADALRHFINLLSSISSESPWYFQEITGIDEALARENWSVGEERKKISIKCLSDPIDHRIETLLSLYRSIVWSQARKCEVLPSNLRKFDMGLYLFPGLINGVTYTKKSFENEQDKLLKNDKIKRGQNSEYDWTDIDGDSDKYNAPFKYLEFHNCEISIDSLKSGYGTINNGTGFEQEFTIDIYFDECYEQQYNPYILRYFGDFFKWDMWSNSGIAGDDTVTGNIPVFNFNYDETQLADTSDNNNNTVERQNAMAEENKIKNTINNMIDEVKTSALNVVDSSALNVVDSSALNVVDAARSSINNAIIGGLGNIYGNGMGIRGVQDSIQQELSQQIKSLSSKVIGNINDSSTKLMRSATSAVTAPVLGSIKAAGTMADTVVDTATNVVAKPVLGTIKSAETASVRLTKTGTSYIDEAGNYVSNESKRLGDITYNSQVGLANQIGKNRLNAKLGKL